MPLSWNEIKSRSINFSKEWEGESRERAEKDTFWNEFLNIFGISRRRVATFEKAVKKLNDNQGYIDLFWPGTLLVEHKSKGKDLDSAFSQALDYFPGLKDHELPRFIITSDFAEFKVYDLEENLEHGFPLRELTTNISLFGFLAGYEKKTFKEEDPVNIDAAYLMGRLHDRLKEIGYTDHELEIYLVRILFCLFADDTNIFERGIFQEYLDLHTKEDGSDLAAQLGYIFQVLDTPREKRLKNIHEAADQFPYVNGQLFSESLRLPSFDSEMRTMLLDACALDWGKISPAIFGSMFQAAMNPDERRDLGAHYTSEANIQKVIKPLFLDELRTEFKKVKSSSKKLKAFHDRISKLKFLDPACGCGNFLIITYRELRELELDILRELNKTGQGFLNVGDIIKVDIDQFYGIEYDEFPARIAEVAMWLMDHQMNMKLSEEFGQYFVRLPLKKSVSIRNENALRLDWKELVKPSELDFILGNPPFYGYSYQTKEQKEDLSIVFETVKGSGVLDYVAGWYIKAARYIQGSKIEVAFVSTNSISQGEQAGILWKEMFDTLNIKIHFAYRTFKWKNEARGNAAVHVVIIGFGNYDISKKTLFEHDKQGNEILTTSAKNINPYLIDGNDLIILRRSKPLAGIQEMIKGSSPTDGGNLVLTDEEKNNLLKLYPDASQFIRQYIGSREYINQNPRWCLWLKDSKPSELRKFPEILDRIKRVKDFREASRKKSTQKWSESPALFIEDRQPETNYVLIPRVSSERRKYVPMGYLPKEVIVSDSAIALPEANLFTFGILNSLMHMMWMNYTCGRLKSDFRYSNTLVYNNFPFPQEVNQNSKTEIENAAQKILDVRLEFPGNSLADLYDPLMMPRKLLKAHQRVDKAVDLAYRPQPFPDERRRIEFLFELYEELLASQEKAKKV
ncbi:DNA methyltransferase [Christiangramia forsetii]|uniref:site-specific DNA-methyltransferase (adenine-specific) n=2 Tax=Christiangramia forsetii TaxID=411153 RepID=A0LY01_CHRFK|nr:DNA methyltransferase [Christiangramia forsetii]GGG35355.1 methylase [Christiangramia forsetii]CAL65246.1 conserved hypothetical protein-most likely a DNA methylase [Christiangramia forsetii KT0803]